LDGKKELERCAPGLNLVQWNNADDLPPSAKAFSNNVSGLYALRLENTIVPLTGGDQFAGILFNGGAVLAPSRVFDSSAVVPAVGAYGEVGNQSYFIGYAAAGAAAPVNHTWNFTLPAGPPASIGGWLVKYKLVPMDVTGGGVVDVLGSNYVVQLNGIEILENQPFHLHGHQVVGAGAASELKIIGTPGTDVTPTNHGYGIVLEHVDPYAAVEYSVGTHDVGSAIYSRDQYIDFSGNDKKVLAIAEAYEEYAVDTVPGFNRFTTGLTINGYALGSEAYRSSSWISGSWGGNGREARTVFRTFAARVSTIVRLAALDCYFGNLNIAF
jgi:hypothetical protein